MSSCPLCGSPRPRDAARCPVCNLDARFGPEPAARPFTRQALWAMMGAVLVVYAATLLVAAVVR